MSGTATDTTTTIAIKVPSIYTYGFRRPSPDAYL
jgi:hypothetical protein